MSCHCPAEPGRPCPLSHDECDDRQRLYEAFECSLHQPDNRFELEQRRRIHEALAHPS